MQNDNGENATGGVNVDEAAFIDSFFLPGGILDPDDVAGTEASSSTPSSTLEEVGKSSSGLYNLSTIPVVTTGSYSPWGNGLVGLTSPIGKSASIPLPLTPSPLPNNLPITQPSLSIISDGSESGLTANSSNFVPRSSPQKWLSSEKATTNKIHSSPLLVPTVRSVMAPPGFESSLFEQKSGWAAVAAGNKPLASTVDDKYSLNANVNGNGKKTEKLIDDLISEKRHQLVEAVPNQSNRNDKKATITKKAPIQAQSKDIPKQSLLANSGESKLTKKPRNFERGKNFVTVEGRPNLSQKKEQTDEKLERLTVNHVKRSPKSNTNTRQMATPSDRPQNKTSPIKTTVDNKSDSIVADSISDSVRDKEIEVGGKLFDLDSSNKTIKHRNKTNSLTVFDDEWIESSGQMSAICDEPIIKIQREIDTYCAPDEIQFQINNTNEIGVEDKHLLTPNRQKAIRSREKRIDEGIKTLIEHPNPESILEIRNDSNSATIQDIKQQSLHEKRRESNMARQREQNDEGILAFIAYFISSVRTTLYWIMECYTDGLIPFMHQILSSIVMVVGIFSQSCLILLLTVANVFKFATDESSSHTIWGVFWSSPSTSCYYVFCLMPSVCDWLMAHVGNLPHFTPHILSNISVYYLCRLLSQVSADTLSQRRKNSKRSSSFSTMGISISSNNTNLAHQQNSDRFGNEVCQLLLKAIGFALPICFIMEGFSRSNSSFMLMEAQKRMILAYLLSLVKRGLILSPVAWVGWSVQVLLSTYLPVGLVLNSLLYFLGLAFIRLVTMLQLEGVPSSLRT